MDMAANRSPTESPEEDDGENCEGKRISCNAHRYSLMTSMNDTTSALIV
jgi:hypothetical protein